jgi:hypothetical protein
MTILQIWLKTDNFPPCMTAYSRHDALSEMLQTKKNTGYVEFEALIGVVMKSFIFWYILLVVR